MIRPDKITNYDDIDLKLGIKSSLPNPKTTIALLILLWRCSDKPAELVYSQQSNDGNSIVLNENLREQLVNTLNPLYSTTGISDDYFISMINENQLFKSQLESLIVAFELVWKIARIKFTDEVMPASAERTGRKRYPKKVHYTLHMDILDSIISTDEIGYHTVLLNWLGVPLKFESKYDVLLKKALTVFTESAVFKLVDGKKDVIFNLNSVYKKILEIDSSVDINGEAEAKGSLRILKSLLADELNPYLSYSSGTVSAKENIEYYQKRVDTFLALSANRIFEEEKISSETGITESRADYSSSRVTGGCNIILYGVPGSGKSFTIENEYCNDSSRMERVVFHPDYSYSDFVGQILPKVNDEGMITYEFSPGPFTRLLKKAHDNPSIEYYLIIEEINRGNAPAIFGDIFQLLDRDSDGNSQYGISNADIARIVYDGDENKHVRIPSNMYIIGTMNTSDQNVFTLDTAFQRRWNMRMIENDLNKADPEFVNQKILDSDISWKAFVTVINTFILKVNSHLTSSEDKRLGVFFVSEKDLKYNSKEHDNTIPVSERLNAAQENSRFPEKVLKYLWDDAFKFSRDSVFKTNVYLSLNDIISKFKNSKGNERFSIFNEEVFDAFFSPANLSES